MGLKSTFTEFLKEMCKKNEYKALGVFVKAKRRRKTNAPQPNRNVFSKRICALRKKKKNPNPLPQRQKRFFFFVFYWVLLGFARFCCVLLDFIWRSGILPIVTRFRTVLLGFTGFYWVLLGFTGFYWVLLGFTGFC